MTKWLLQCNPLKWRIFDFFEAGEELSSWTVSRYLDQIKAGDDFAIWITGGAGGVVAVGKVVDSPARGVVDEVDDAYWADEHRPDPGGWSVPIRVTREFLHSRVRRVDLAEDARFSTALVLRQPQGGNPFPLTDAEWQAILDRLPAGNDRPVLRDPAWSLRPGDTIRRVELHERYGGSGQGGIAPSRTTPNIMIFTDPRSGNQHGYYDEWAEDGTFRYAGQGQRGDQEFTAGNRAIRDHAPDGRALRLFEGVGGVVRYVGEFTLDPDEPYSWDRVHATGGGDERSVIRFHLRRLSEAQAAGSATPSTGVAYRPQNEDAAIAEKGTSAPADPDAFGRGLRSHRLLQNRLADLARQAGFVPLSPSAIDPEYDLGWATGDREVTVVEVKSLTDSNEIRQLRLGLGQVLDYRSILEGRDLTVNAVLYVQRRPIEDRWFDLAASVGVTLIWPGVEDRVVRPSSTRGLGARPAPGVAVVG